MEILLTLFKVFFKIGLFTFGGGYAMIPFIQETVAKYKWMDAKEMVNFIAISEATPGPLAVNMSTYLGFKVCGVFGAIAATVGVCLPSLIVIILISRAYKCFKESIIVRNMMRGIKPAVVGLISASTLTVANNVFDFTMDDTRIFSFSNITSFFIVVAAGGMMYKKCHPIAVICVSAVLGIAFNCLK